MYQALKRLLLALLIAFPFFVQAQDHHELGLTVGVSNYWGDLQPKLFPSNGYRPMAGFIYKFFMNPRVGIRIGATYSNLTAADSLSNIPANQARNLSFATHLFEFHTALEVNFLPVDILRMKASPYIFGGISVFYFDPYATDSAGNKVFLRPLSTEGEGLPMYPDRKEYSLVNIAFPFGGGMKFFIGKAIMLTGEVGFRYTNTSYLDDVSKTFVNLDTLAGYKGQLARQMAFRGNTVPGWDGNYPNYGTPRGSGGSNDWYYFCNITATVYLRAIGHSHEYSRTKCPKP